MNPATHHRGECRAPPDGRSPPDGPDGRDADGWRLAVLQAADGGLEELLDELRGHGRGEAAGSPQGPAQQEGRRGWGGGEVNQTTSAHKENIG